MAINNPRKRLEEINKANATPHTKDGVSANTSKGVGNSGSKPAGTGSTNITLRNGSTGVDVKDLQKALIAEGYNVGKAGADGIYGNATAAAVRKYQQDNGLAVDGIAGKDTLGLLYGSTNSGSKPVTTTVTMKHVKPVTTGGNAKPVATKTTIPGNVIGQKRPETPAHTTTSTPTTPATPSEPFTYEDFNYDKEFSYDDFSYSDFSYADYAESDIVKQANALLQQHLAGKPGDFVDPYFDQRMEYRNQLENRDPFSYDFNSDALYNQYKDQYIQQGKMAMMDTMGQAAAMTGGYGNSYAQTVGQQAYNQQLGQLNNIMPELYQMAYDRYNQQGQDLLNMYDLYTSLSEEEYGKYQDSMTNWYEQLGYLNDNYINERNFDYGKWSSDRSLAYDDYVADRNLAYNQYQGEKDDAKWQAEFDAQDSRWWAEFEQDEKQNNYNNLAGLISSTGYTPSASELKAAGMSESEAKALKDSYTASINTTGDSGYDINHVSSMSSAELVGYLESYNKKGNNSGLEAFLDDCVYSGRLTQQQADEYYARYRTQEKPGGPGNTDVDALPSYYPFASQAEKDAYEARQKQNQPPFGTIDFDNPYRYRPTK